MCPFLGIILKFLARSLAPALKLLLARCSAALGALGSVLRPALLTVGHAHRIQRAAHNVIAHTRKILHTAAADQHNRVLLQVVADAGNVGGDLNPVGLPDTSHLT